MAFKIFISAGDPSGDKHAARVMRELKNSFDEVKFIGIGGPEMEKEGLSSIVPMTEISVVGFLEVAKKYGFFLSLINKCKDIIKNEKPDLFLPVDYPGFNIRLAEFARNQGTKVVYYIAPQLWAWGRNRTRKLQKSVDKLLVVFPFEEKFFKSEDIDTTFVGHPSLEDNVFQEEIEKDRNLIALLPGSRNQEIKNHLELFLETTKYFPSNFKFGIAKSPNIPIDMFEIVNKYKNCEIWDNSRDLMKKAFAGIVKTGTSNLEACFCEMPFSMVYKTSFFTYQLAKNLINLDYISIVNILTNKSLVPEIIQSDAKPKKLASSLLEIINNQDRYDNIVSDFKNIKSKLKEKKASKKSAKIIKKMFE